ncbi:MAG: monovalent cation/H+ antiporter complex subunit F [Terrimicrobiaceae bacterium]
METSPIIITAAWFATIIVALGMVLAFVRLAKGPSLPDRVVAIDALATMGVGALVATSITTGQAVLLDIALAMALITFLGTIALALSIQKGIFK